MTREDHRGHSQRPQGRAGRRRLAINLHPDSWPDQDKAAWQRAARETTAFDEEEGRIAHWKE
jgi:hypothetical protein